MSHHLPKMRVKLNALRQAAAAELRNVTQPNAQPLPGPSECNDWLGWFWSTGDATEQTVDDLRALSPSLASFLESVIREQWRPGLVEPSSAADHSDQALDLDRSAVNIVEQAQPPPPASDKDLHESSSTSTSGQNGSKYLVETASEPENVREEPGACEQIRSANGEMPSTSLVNDSTQPSPDVITDTTAEIKGHTDSHSLLNVSHPIDRIHTHVLPLSPELASFDKFRRSHWITPQGDCKAALWSDSTAFGEQVTVALFRALEAEQFGRAKVFAAAAKQVECNTAPSPDEVETWSRLWQNPRDAVGLGMDGVLQLRLAAGEGRLNSACVWKLRLCLEAIRPSRDLPLTHGEEEEWMEAIDFRSGTLRQVLLLLMRIRARDRSTDGRLFPSPGGIRYAAGHTD